MRSILLYMIGIPIPVIILIAFLCAEKMSEWVTRNSARESRGYYRCGSSKSGRNRLVFSRAAALRHFRISAWLPPINTSGAFQARYSAGRVHCG